MAVLSPCRTCGRYITPEEAHARHWCSAQCTYVYGTCTNCGKYYIPREGFSEGICSPDCGKRYALQRKYGPEPVKFIFEE